MIRNLYRYGYVDARQLFFLLELLEGGVLGLEAGGWGLPVWYMGFMPTFMVT